MMGYEPMAISSYLGWLIFLMLTYPFALVAIQLTVFDIRIRAVVNRVFNVTALLLALFLLIMHMQTEVIYGKPLLDAWHAKQQSDTK